MSTTSAWRGTLTATSSIAHGGELRGTIRLLRREIVLDEHGAPLHVPVVSGNAVRGRLRRIGEELLRDCLDYAGQLPLPAAHALRAGGALAKVSGEPLSGARLRTVRSLVPQIEVFGAAAGGRIVDGALQVGKLMPHLAQTRHLTGNDGPSATRAVQLESYVRHDDSDTLEFADLHPATQTPLLEDGSPDHTRLDALSAEPSRLMLWRIETFPAGTRFAHWMTLSRATPLAHAFFTDIVDEFTRTGHVGGRAGIGHGQIRADYTRTDHPAPPAALDWRAHLRERRSEVIDALHLLT